MLSLLLFPADIATSLLLPLELLALSIIAYVPAIFVMFFYIFLLFREVF